MTCPSYATGTYSALTSSIFFSVFNAISCFSLISAEISLELFKALIAAASSNMLPSEVLNTCKMSFSHF